MMTLPLAFRRCWWLLLPVLAGAIGFAWRAGVLERTKTILPGGPPVIEYPAVIDLGDRTANEVVSSRFQIVNRGGQELVIDQIKASCSCGKLEREIGDRSEAIEELHLSPGERADMVVHTTIRTDAAGTFHQTITFWTNDPKQSEGRITIVFHTASGGLRVYPAAVQFGRLLIGQKARQMVDVLDRDQPPQTVTNVVSADPERVSIRWLPAAKNTERREEAVLLGQIEVVPNTAKALLLDTAVRIEFADPKIQAITIPISGRVTPKVEVTPQSLVLPLSSRDGPVYTRNCVIRGPDGCPWRLVIETASPGLTATLRESSNGATRVVQITWKPSSGEGPAATKKIVRLRARIEEEFETIEVPVTCEHQ